MRIEVPIEEMKKELESSYTRIQQKANIRGFRKGKVPLDLVKTQYASQAQSETLERVIERAVSFALKEKNINAISPATIKDLNIDPGFTKPFSFIAEVEVNPEITLGKYKKIKLLEEIKLISEEDIQKSLTTLQERSAELVPVEKEMVEEKDHLILDYWGYENGKDKEVAKGQNQLFVAGNSDYLSGFSHKLIGLKRGEKHTFDIQFPKDYFNKKLQDKEVHFEVFIKEIKEKVLPTLNDEFAKNLGEESLHLMREKIANSLRSQEDRRSQEKLKSDLIEKLLEITPCAVPSYHVDQQTQYLIEQHKKSYAHRGGSAEEVNSDDLKKRYTSIAERQIRVMYIFEKIAQEEKIEVTTDEIDQEKNKALEHAQAQKKDIEEYFNAHMSEIKHRLREEKIFNFLLKNAKIKTSRLK